MPTTAEQNAGKKQQIWKMGEEWAEGYLDYTYIYLSTLTWVAE